MKYLIMCLTILSATSALADTIGDTTPDYPSYDFKAAAIAIVPAPVATAHCPPFKYPVNVPDAVVFKKTMGELTEQAIIAEVRRLTGNKLAIGLVHSEIAIGVAPNAQGCKELVDSMMAVGKRYSDGCQETFEILIPDQNIAANVGKFDVKPQLKCPHYQDQAQSFHNP